MKKLCKVMAASLFLLTALVLFGTVKAEAAPTPQTLAKGKNYTINLNGGKAETVSWTTTASGDAEIFKLKVNGKFVLSYSNLPGGSIHVSKVKVLDTNTGDKYKEIFVDCTGDGSNWGMMIIRYYNASNVRVFKQITARSSGLKNAGGRLSSDGLKTNGKGVFYLCTDTPFYSDSFGCYNALVPAKLENGKIRLYASNYGHTIYKASQNVPGNYTLAKSMKLYTGSGCTSSKETLSSGTRFMPSKVRVLSASKGKNSTKYTVSVYVKTTSGKTGWLKFPANQSGYLRYRPTWG